MKWTRQIPDKAGFYFYREKKGEIFLHAVTDALCVMLGSTPNPFNRGACTTHIPLVLFPAGEWSDAPVKLPKESQP